MTARRVRLEADRRRPADRLRRGYGGPPTTSAQGYGGPPKLQRRRKLYAKAEAGHYGSLAWRAALIVAALGAALAPFPPSAVERLYSSTLYPALQHALTSVSNLVPFAMFDALVVSITLAWMGLLVRDIVAGPRDWLRVFVRVAARSVALAAALYLAFLATWGLNYRRVPLADKLEFDPRSVSADRARALALKAVAEVNRLYPSSDRAGTGGGAVDPSLAGAFSHAQQELGVERAARPARPKRSLVDLYFRRAAVDAMTDPYFLETLVVSDLLPFERSFVVAHEWSHLAGFADEGEANFVGWLACLRGSHAAQYSAWLFLYREAVAAIRADDRPAVVDRLASGPRDDLRAISERIRRQANPMLSAAGWQVYDRYLKANRVEAGTASYAEVVRLVLGVRFSAAGVPERRRTS